MTGPILNRGIDLMLSGGKDCDKLIAVLAQVLGKVRDAGMSEDDIALAFLASGIDAVKRAPDQRKWSRYFAELSATLAPVGDA
jgi:hypothetical protein